MEFNYLLEQRQAFEAFAEKTEYFKVGLNGINLLDPITKEQLSRKGVPAFARQDTFTQDGLRHLSSEYANKKLSITLVTGLHGGQKDFEDLKNSAGWIIENSDLVAVENEVAATDKHILKGSPNFEMDFNPKTSGHGIYQRAQFDWLSEQKKIILPSDHLLKIDDEQPLVALLSQIHLKSCELGESESPVDKSLSSITNGQYQFVREWNMLGRIGNQIKSLGSDEPRNLAIILGYYHLSIPEKLNQLGIDVDTHIVKGQDSLGKKDYARINFYRTGYISFEDLNYINPIDHL